MKKIVVSIVAFCLSFLTLQAQSYVIDAFRFSQINWQGTARSMGAGGAFGAVGAEYSALSTNPASMGIYKKSEVSFTPVVVSIFNASSMYEGKTSNYLSSNYSLTNFGIVMVAPIKESPWKNVQFAFGYNRINDFNNSFRVEGMVNSSITKLYANSANGTNLENLNGELEMAFNIWAIDTLSGSVRDYESLSTANEINQKQFVKTRGGIDEMNFTVGGNYDDKLYVGATIGVPFLKYQETVTYEEKNMDENPVNMTDFTKRTDLRVRGTGVNLKLGLIYQPVDYFRIGAAFHTPTYYSLRETYNIEISSVFSDGWKGMADNTNEYSYRLVTPLRASANMAFLINRKAFISADYEFTNYGMAKMYASDYGFDDENADITKKYGASHTIKMGAE
ncbi:MAG: hypothetical protein LBV02_02400, partial [Bacteroidales bacterium]|nr:hypothetical protein [Bacteroidales bacterium]